MTDVGLYILEMFNEWKAGWMNGLIDGWKFLIFFLVVTYFLLHAVGN